MEKQVTSNKYIQNTIPLDLLPVGTWLWSQTWHYATLHVAVPFNTKKADISLTLGPKHITLAVKDLIDIKEELNAGIYIEDSTWTIDVLRTGVKLLNVEMKKVIIADTEMWWWRLFKSQEEIYDVTTRPKEGMDVRDMSVETRSTFQRSYEHQFH